MNILNKQTNIFEIMFKFFYYTMWIIIHWYTYILLQPSQTHVAEKINHTKCKIYILSTGVY